MIVTTQAELKRLKKVASESVRRGVSYDDWMDECVPRLMNGGEDRDTAIILCEGTWYEACGEEGIKL